MRLVRAKALMYLEGMKTGGSAPADISAVARALVALEIIYEAEGDPFIESKNRRKRNVPEFLKGSVMSEDKRMRPDRRKA